MIEPPRVTPRRDTRKNYCSARQATDGQTERERERERERDEEKDEDEAVY